MKKQPTLLTTDQTLAGLIFVLWSMSTFVRPVAGYAKQTPLTTATLAVYLSLHLVIGLFCLFTLYGLHWRNKKIQQSGAYVRTVLYVYVLGGLGTSLFFIAHTIFT